MAPMHGRGLALIAGTAGAAVAFLLVHVMPPDPFSSMVRVAPPQLLDQQRLNLLFTDLRLSVMVGLAVGVVMLVGRTAWTLRASYPLALAALVATTWILAIGWVSKEAAVAFRFFTGNVPTGWFFEAAYFAALATLAWFVVDALTTAHSFRPPDTTAVDIPTPQP